MSETKSTVKKWFHTLAIVIAIALIGYLVVSKFDVFSKDGYYLYKTVCKHTPFLIKDGYYYTRLQNEESGEVFVKRYIIKNWDQIKVGVSN